MKWKKHKTAYCMHVVNSGSKHRTGTCTIYWCENYNKYKTVLNQVKYIWSKKQSKKVPWLSWLCRLLVEHRSCVRILSMAVLPIFIIFQHSPFDSFSPSTLHHLLIFLKTFNKFIIYIRSYIYNPSTLEQLIIFLKTFISFITYIDRYILNPPTLTHLTFSKNF